MYNFPPPYSNFYKSYMNKSNLHKNNSIQEKNTSKNNEPIKIPALCRYFFTKEVSNAFNCGEHHGDLAEWLWQHY